MNLNDNYKLALKSSFTDRNVVFKFKIDYTQQINEYHFVGYGDIFAKLGGLKSALGPVFDIVVPCTIFNFLWMLVAIIKNKYKQEYILELEKTVKLYFNQLS